MTSRKSQDLDEEEKMLFRQLRQTRSAALRQQLIEANGSLVGFLAGKFAERGEPLADLIQVGMIGLINAVDRFDPERGIRFSTYATPTIVGEIKRHFRDKGWSLKVPRRLQELNLKISKLSQDLAQELGREPTLKEVMEEVGENEETTLEAIALSLHYHNVSLEGEVDQKEGYRQVRTFEDFLAFDDPNLKRIEWHGDLRQALGQLDPRCRAILYYRFFEELPQTKVAEILGISQMHISRLQRKAIITLREILSRDGHDKEEEMTKSKRSETPKLGGAEIRLLVEFISRIVREGQEPASLEIDDIAGSLGRESPAVEADLEGLQAKGIIARSAGGYQLGTGAFIADFVGRAPWKVRPGVLIEPGREYALKELVGKIAEAQGGSQMAEENKNQENAEVEKNNDRQGVITGRNLRVVVHLWDKLSRSEPRPIGPLQPALAAASGIKEDQIAPEVLRLVKAGVLCRVDKEQYLRGNEVVEVSLVTKKTVLELAPCIVVSHGQRLNLDDLVASLQETQAEQDTEEPTTEPLSLEAIKASLATTIEGYTTLAEEAERRYTAAFENETNRGRELTEAQQRFEEAQKESAEANSKRNEAFRALEHLKAAREILGE